MNIDSRMLVLILAVNVVGSIVDFAQFIWLMKRSWFRWRRSLYHKVERQVLEDQEKARRKRERQK